MTVAASCGGAPTRTVPRLSPFADEVAKALGIGKQQADDLLTSTSREVGLKKSAVAEQIVDDADLIATDRSRFRSILDDIKRNADLEQAAADTLCEALQEARVNGEPPTFEEVFASLVRNVGEDYANRVADTGAITRFIELTASLTSGDQEQVSILVAESLYC